LSPTVYITIYNSTYQPACAPCFPAAAFADFDASLPADIDLLVYLLLIKHFPVLEAELRMLIYQAT
jgi:hypothetical protein